VYLGRAFDRRMLRVLCVLYASTMFMSCSAQCPANQYVTVNAIDSRALALTPGKAQLTKFATRTTTSIIATAVYDATAGAVTFQSGQSVPGGTHNFLVQTNGFTVVLMVKFSSSGSQTLFDFASGARIIMWSPGGNTLRFAISNGGSWCETQLHTIVVDTWHTIVGTWNQGNNRLGIKIDTESANELCTNRADLNSLNVQLGGAANGNGAFTGSMKGFYAVDSALSNAALDTIVSNMNANKDTLGECQQCPNGLASAPNSVSLSDCGCARGYTLLNSVCSICESGKFKATIGSLPCGDCLFGSSSMPGSATCECKAGYTGADGATCTLCLAGTYKNVTGAATCQACPSKSTSPIGSSNSSGCQCLEGYIDRAPGANNCQPPPPHELALCADLANATAHVLALDANQHSVARLREARCVHIDPCTQLTRAGVPAAAGAWLHVAALGLTSSGDGAHYNHHALEYARVPQGIILETCPPDFAHYRATGTWRCDADPATHVRIEGACPSLLPHTILDCLAPTQFDAGSESKHLISL